MLIGCDQKTSAMVLRNAADLDPHPISRGQIRQQAYESTVYVPPSQFDGLSVIGILRLRVLKHVYSHYRYYGGPNKSYIQSRIAPVCLIAAL